MINVGDRVHYDEENTLLGLADDMRGTVVEPTEDEKREKLAHLDCDDVRVQWDDGERFWEVPDSLVVVVEEDA